MDGAAPSDLTLQLGVLPDTSEILANAGPFGTQVGFGAVAGYCAGVALRVAGTAGLALAGGAPWAAASPIDQKLGQARSQLPMGLSNRISLA